jgi:hypothetical protein
VNNTSFPTHRGKYGKGQGKVILERKTGRTGLRKIFPKTSKEKLTTARASGRLNINREQSLVNKTRKILSKNLKMKLTTYQEVW